MCENKNFRSIYLSTFLIDLDGRDMLLKLISVMNLILILSHLIGSQGIEPKLGDFVKKNHLNLVLHSGISRPISLKLA